MHVYMQIPWSRYIPLSRNVRDVVVPKWTRRKRAVDHSDGRGGLSVRRSLRTIDVLTGGGVVFLTSQTPLKYSPSF